MRLMPPPPRVIHMQVYVCVGWVGVGWQRHCRARRSLRELDNQGTYRLFLRSPYLAVELAHFVRGGEPLLRTGGMFVSCTW